MKSFTCAICGEEYLKKHDNSERKRLRLPERDDNDPTCAYCDYEERANSTDYPQDAAYCGY